MIDVINTLSVDRKKYQFYDLQKCSGSERLPFSLKILLENLLRHQENGVVQVKDINNLINWDSKAIPSFEISYHPARVLMQDFTGVPAVVDLAVMSEAVGGQGKINPVLPTELVVDHSIQVDYAGSQQAVQLNAKLEYKRNNERYQFLKWAQQNFSNFKIIPPGAGIVHQINLEYLARVVFVKDGVLYPDTLVGTDSHTTMVNGLGVLGWGVGGIEAEAAMLGLPSSMLIPQVIGVELTGRLAVGTTATDLVLTLVEKLRQYGVVGKFVEFFGSGISELSLSDRATIANMAPEYGATCGFFPLDNESLNYLALTNRDQHHIDIVESYARHQGLFYASSSVQPDYTAVITLDLDMVVPSIAGPKRPQDRIAVKDVAATVKVNKLNQPKNILDINNGSIVLAAITSCTNTSNSAVMLAAGLLAKNAVALGLKVKPWVKTSLAPGSGSVAKYLDHSGCSVALDELNFHIVGYGCTTCIGNSGPLKDGISAAIKLDNLDVASVLSGNRNFEGRIHADIVSNYLASPPLVIAYAISGRIDIDFARQPLGMGKDNKEVFLHDIWPSNHDITEAIAASVKRKQFATTYVKVLEGDEQWQNLPAVNDKSYKWQDKSTYIRRAPFFDDFTLDVPEVVSRIENAYCLASFGDSITTDHISPAGSIKLDSPAGEYLQASGVDVADFNSYGSRRGNHEVMMRGTFANVRIKNLLVPEIMGGMTLHIPTEKIMSIYAAAMLYQKHRSNQIILAGAEYGSGSSRDWAAKGPKLLGVKAVIAISFERIHRSNLVGMGILPLQFEDGQNAQSLGLDGSECFTIDNIDGEQAKTAYITAVKQNKSKIEFKVGVRIDTPLEYSYYLHGGILPYIVRNL